MFSALKSYLFPAPLTLVTASDASHARSLMNFLASAKEHEPATKLIVYDLGLTAQERQAIESRFGYEVRTFDFSRYPSFFNIKVAAGEYAWKPTIVHEVSKETTGVLCWMDAGNIITEPLQKLRRETQRYGYYSPHSSGTVQEWTHPGMLSYFGLPADWQAGSPNLNGACIAFDMQSSIGADLIALWAEYALIKECIAPEGSNRANHRQDQALLTVLAYRAGRPSGASKKYLGYAIHRDVELQKA